MANFWHVKDIINLKRANSISLCYQTCHFIQIQFFGYYGVSCYTSVYTGKVWSNKVPI